MVDVEVELGKLEIDNFESRPFVPLCKLEEYFRFEKVQNLLLESIHSHGLEHHFLNVATERILAGGLRTFAILSSIRDIRSVSRFIRADQFSRVPLDNKLPLEAGTISRYIPDSAKATLFFRRQWTFLAPVFSEDYVARELDDRTVLPFLSRENISKGGFGRVYKVKVHGSHQCLSNTHAEVEMVCKQLERPNANSTLARDFEHEARILSSLHCLQHPNIIRLIAAFSKGPEYYFLFPIAQGDLAGLFKKDYRVPGLQSQLEILGSLWGLSSALEEIHNYFLPQSNLRQVGAHFDLKPKNILYQDGKLLLADFGLSRLREEEDGSQITFVAGEGDYIAPECESIVDGFKRGRIGRASDVWSFGCVVAEMLVYLSEEPANAPAAIDDFSMRRSFVRGGYRSRLFHMGDQLNPAVLELLKRCKDNAGSLGVVAEIVEGIIKLDSSERPPMAEITKSLFHVTQQARIALIESNFDKPMDFELEVELERLNIWTKTVGLRSTSLDAWASSWIAMDRSGYDKLQDVLCRMEIEVHIIAMQLRNTRPASPPFRLYYRLQRLQDELWDMQNTNIRRDMFSHLEDKLLARAGDFPSEEDVKTTSETETNTLDTSSASLSLQLQRRLVCFRVLRDITSMTASLEHPTDILHMDKADFIQHRSQLKDHVVANYEPQKTRVLIEILRYEEAMIFRVEELRQRVIDIASFRSKDVIDAIFPVLKCIGYYEDPTQLRFGVVYQLPEKSANTAPIDFCTALKRTKSRRVRPSLTQCFTLASALVEHVLDFHRGGWLHKGISAFNIICFPDAFPGVADCLAAPYFVGFNHSRMNEDSEYSSLPEMQEYQHPTYLKNLQTATNDIVKGVMRFRQEFDYYSVGMVLVEIALWKPLEEITERFRGTPEEMLEWFLEDIVPLVRVSVGTLYGDAVTYCLTAYCDSERSMESVRNDFAAEVVSKISRCLV